METLREILLTIRLDGGDVRQVRLPEDAPELMTLFGALANPGGGSQLVQLPLDGGRVAWSFQTSRLLSIESTPPVVLSGEQLASPTQPASPTPPLNGPQPPQPPLTAAMAPALRVRRPRFHVVDDFLSPQEHDELLAYALLSEAHFQAGTVASYEPGVRQNQVILNFGDSVHSRLLENRLLVWLPLLGRRLQIPVFPLTNFESQLTAARDGYYFKTHTDEGPDIPRVLTCIYYLHREPRGFAGGELRLYDCVESGESRHAAETFTVVQPTANRLVVFASDEFHEALPVRCPSGQFADSRFAVTMWAHRGDKVDPQARFGWGYFGGGAAASPAGRAGAKA